MSLVKHSQDYMIVENSPRVQQNSNLVKPLFFIAATLAVYMLTFTFINSINYIVFSKSIVSAFIVLAIVVSVAFLWGHTAGYLLKSVERKIDRLKALQ